MWHKSSPSGCRHCHRQERPHVARGLCTSCYDGHQKAGTLWRFPTTNVANGWDRHPERAVATTNHRRIRAEREARQRAIREQLDNPTGDRRPT